MQAVARSAAKQDSSPSRTSSDLFFGNLVVNTVVDGAELVLGYVTLLAAGGEVVFDVRLPRRLFWLSACAIESQA